MKYMFYYCDSLIELDLSNFRGFSVIDTSSMFGYCTKLKKLDLSNFKLSKTTEVCDMFGGCSSLKNLHGLVKQITNNFYEETD
jgi:surface protein